MTIRIVALSDYPLERDCIFYADFLQEVAIALDGKTNVPTASVSGKLRCGLHFKAMEIEVNAPIKYHSEVWGVVPSGKVAKDDQLDHFSEWLTRLDREEISQGAFGLNKGEILAGFCSSGFCYRTVMSTVLFDVLMGRSI